MLYWKNELMRLYMVPALSINLSTNYFTVAIRVQGGHGARLDRRRRYTDLKDRRGTGRLS